jgi:diadenosine tetraphosphate (Ap4A) HIT family hydrolase
VSCPFCNLKNSDITAESEHSIAKLDGFPVSVGHTLIISKRHVADFFELSQIEQQDMLSLLNQVRSKYQSQSEVSNYNVGLNCGPLAGQTVGHVHLHLIPRREGDVIDPRGGVRWVIPDKAKYWDE